MNSVDTAEVTWRSESKGLDCAEVNAASPADKVAQRDAMANPDSLNWFVALARQPAQQADHR